MIIYLAKTLLYIYYFTLLNRIVQAFFFIFQTFMKQAKQEKIKYDPQSQEKERMTFLEF